MIFPGLLLVSDRCFLLVQDALETYMKLPHKHYNTGWILSQVHNC